MSDDLKKRAAEEALDHIKNGMIVGLGTGSTADHFIRGIAEMIQDGLDVQCVPTSKRTEEYARSLGIPLVEIGGANEIDVTVDGADEIDGELRLIKGAGGALLREKIVASASKQMIVIADQSKLVPVLGKFPLPIEVVRFGLAATTEHIFWALKEAGITPAWVRLRENTHERPAPYVTDSGNLIIDCACGAIPDADGLASALSEIPGVVEHGLFVRLANIALIGRSDRVVDELSSTWRRTPAVR